MTRAVYVLPPGSNPARFLGPATAAGATEIAVGIPPALVGVIDPADLPVVHVESDPPTPADPPPADPAAASLEERLTALEELGDYLLGIQLDQHEEAP